jgi:putative nucleotidyltransferase with HDIG domain
MNGKKETHSLIKPGDHLVVLYNEEKEVIDAVVSYISAAIQRNDRCIYITGDADTNLLKEELSLHHNVDGLISCNQLLFWDKEDSYSKDGSFEPDLMVDTLNKLAKDAVSEGFNGLAITGEISWVLNIEHGFEKIIEYEWKINEYVFTNSRISALCRYNINKFTDEMIINIIEVHPFIVLKGRVHENPFYIPSEGYLSNNVRKFQVDEMLKNIVKFENSKSEFNTLLNAKTQEIKDIQERINSEMLRAMISLLEFHDPYTKDHSTDVAALAMKLGNELGLPEFDCRKLFYAALVHDIGKIVLPKTVLNKKEPLEYDEIGLIKQHPITAYETLIKLESLKEIALIVRHHHERYDGRGYPDFLIGDDIPLSSRIISVVDSFDAMTNKRPYRDALTKEVAIMELIDGKNTQFDSKIVDAFLRIV